MRAAKIVLSWEYGESAPSNPLDVAKLTDLRNLAPDAYGPPGSQAALATLIDVALAKTSAIGEDSDLHNASQHLCEAIAPFHPVPFGMTSRRLRNHQRMAAIVRQSDSRLHDLFPDVVVVPAGAPDNEVHRCLVIGALVPIFLGLDQLGAIVELVSTSQAEEMGIRVGQAFLRQRVGFRSMAPEVMAAMYEAYVFGVLARAGYEPEFVTGAGNPDIVCPADRLLVEGKDSQTPHSARHPNDKGVAVVRKKIADAEAQLEAYPNCSKYTPLVFVDLPEKTFEGIVKRSVEENNEFWQAVLQESRRPDNVVFTAFDLCQHQVLSPESFVGPQSPMILWPTGVRRCIPVIERVRQRLTSGLVQGETCPKD